MTAFDRLFDKAVNKLNLACTAQDKDEARRHFSERFDAVLRVADELPISALPEQVMAEMERRIEELQPAQIAEYIASGPLALQLQEVVRLIAVRAAEQRVLEHIIGRADDTYGGN